MAAQLQGMVTLVEPSCKPTEQLAKSRSVYIVACPFNLILQKLRRTTKQTNNQSDSEKVDNANVCAGNSVVWQQSNWAKGQSFYFS